METSTDERKILTQEEEEEEHLAASILMDISRAQCAHCQKQSSEEDNDEVASTPLLQVIKAHQKQSRKRKDADHKNQHKKAKKENTLKICDESVFSGEILSLIDLWYKTVANPQEIFGDAEVTALFSKPIKKQLTLSDVKKDQSRLMLSNEQVEKLMLPFLEKSENQRLREGLDVLVYGPDAKAHEMKFKIWNGKTPVLTSGWKEFVAKYGLMKHSDFVTVWMFRHITTPEIEICFAIACDRFPLKNIIN